MAPRKRKNTVSPSASVVGSLNALVADNQRLVARVAELEAEHAAIVAALGGSSSKSSAKSKSSAGSLDARKTRKKVTDPAVLEVRRNALAKARAARAAKRAAADTDAVNDVVLPADVLVVAEGEKAADLGDAAVGVTGTKPKRVRRPRPTSVAVTASDDLLVTLSDEVEVVSPEARPA